MPCVRVRVCARHVFFYSMEIRGQVEVEGAGSMLVGDIAVGDRVQSSTGFSRVYFIHDHVEHAPIVQLSHAHGLSSSLTSF